MSNSGSKVAKTDPEHSIGFLLRDVHRTLVRVLDERIGQHGITSGMWWFLRALWFEDGLSQSELSERVKVQGPTTVRALDRLQRAGLIERRRSSTDKRMTQVYLSSKGRALEEPLLRYVVEVNEVASHDLTDEEVGNLLTILTKISKSLEKRGYMSGAQIKQ